MNNDSSTTRNSSRPRRRSRAWGDARLRHHRHRHHAGALDYAGGELARHGTTTDPLVHTVIGDCTILLETSHTFTYRHADEVHGGRLFSYDSQPGIARCALVKHVATTNAVRALHHLADVLGGASYSRAPPFERIWRDVQAGTFMPMGNLAARALIDASTLGITAAPVTGLDETGHEC
ncbi:acyl-CoA dehydrogenase family protein [Amycolatopsis sp. CA-230715]|uniref:acyl-CoA dehydrogenase family protein n=1 Tax=Amycolatopsis sp. CA-230715 TaxID=2745196 RepID=UPI001C0251A9|nr:acyl-CoA dehydrogenase family protein [Amycolatopsis sp. CA-230715]